MLYKGRKYILWNDLASFVSHTHEALFYQGHAETSVPFSSGHRVFHSFLIHQNMRGRLGSQQQEAILGYDDRIMKISLNLVLAITTMSDPILAATSMSNSLLVLQFRHVSIP